MQPVDIQKLTRIYEGALFRHAAEHPSLELREYAEGLVQRLGQDLFEQASVAPRVRVRMAPTPGVEIYPHGLIVIDAGVFALVENEDELAAMLAHEIAHFVNDDILRDERFERMAQGTGTAIGLVAAAAVATALGPDTSGSNAQQLGQVGMQLGFLVGKLVARVYSRRLELRADRSALELLRAQELSDRALLTVLERLSERGEDSRPRPGGIARFHPALAERAERLRRLVEAQATARPLPEPIARIALELHAQTIVLECSQGKLARGQQRVGELLSRHPESADAHLARAECMRLESPDGPDFDAQIGAYWDALLLDPELETAHAELGLLYRRLGRREEAGRAFASYLRLDPGSVRSAIFSGYLERSAPRPADAPLSEDAR